MNASSKAIIVYHCQIVKNGCILYLDESFYACHSDLFSVAKDHDYYCQYGQSFAINSSVTASFSFIEVYPLGSSQGKRKNIIIYRYKCDYISIMPIKVYNDSCTCCHIEFFARF